MGQRVAVWRGGALDALADRQSPPQPERSQSELRYWHSIEDCIFFHASLSSLGLMLDLEPGTEFDKCPKTLAGHVRDSIANNTLPGG
jgi:hypothetical protein